MKKAVDPVRLDTNRIQFHQACQVMTYKTVAKKGATLCVMEDEIEMGG